MKRLFRRITTISAVMLCLSSSPHAAAEMGIFSEGKQSFGLGLGGGSDQFVFSGAYGLFVRDGFKPETSVRFSWSRSGDATTKQLDWEIGARYYFTKPEPVSPLAHAFTTFTRLSFEHPVSSVDDVFGNVRIAAGVFVLVGQAIGMEVTGGFLQHFAVEEELIRQDIISDELEPFYRIGLSLMF